MNRRKICLVAGTLIILFGVIVLLGNLNIIPNGDHFLGGVLLLSAAAFFIYIYRRDTTRWALLLPIVLLTVWGAGIIVAQFFPAFDDLIWPLLLFSLFVFFVYVFTLSENFWWAVIPAGVCFSWATFALTEALLLLTSDYGGVVLLSGTGLTFVYLRGLRRGGHTFRWAIWPAVIFLAPALMALAGKVSWLNNYILLSVLLILVGGRLILNAVKNRR
jgi:uncharacterized membrane protein YhhN